MGPRSCERGNRRRKAMREINERLQWGRARASAEMRIHALLNSFLIQLQWGRARASAEICSRA